MFVRKLATSEDNKLSGTPFVAFDLQKNTFCFIDFDFTSIYYLISKISDNTFQLKVEEAYVNYNFEASRDGEIFDLRAKHKYPLSKAGNTSKLYFEEKLDRTNS